MVVITKITLVCVGVLDLRSIDEILKKLNFAQNDRILVVDGNGTAIVDSYGNNIQNKNTTTITGIKPLLQMKEFKDILNRNVASRIEIINGIKTFVMYEPFKVGTHRWGIILIEPAIESQGSLSLKAFLERIENHGRKAHQSLLEDNRIKEIQTRTWACLNDSRIFMTIVLDVTTAHFLVCNVDTIPALLHASS